MPDPPILPTIREVIGPAKDRIIEVRPTAAPHLDAGRWAAPLRGWRGQFALANARLAEEATAARLGTSSGAALTELARSNYDTPRPAGGTKALGSVTLARKVVHAAQSDALDTISADDASDVTSLVALLFAISASFSNVVIGHIRSVFDAPSGLGAHLLADPSAALVVVGVATMGDLVTTAKNFKQSVNWHFANKRIDTGAALAIHKDPDTLNPITAPDPFTPSLPLAAFASAPIQEQQRLLLCVNAIKRAVNAHVALEAKPGTVRKGHVFALAAVAGAAPAVAGGQYLATRDVYVPAGAATVDVAVEALRAGAEANLPAWATYAPTLTVAPRSPLFDQGASLPFAATGVTAAGGGDGQPDATLRQAAAASWAGTYGPTPPALLAGTLRSLGVVKCPLREDTATGRAYVYPIDASWAQSARWTAAVEQTLRGTGRDDEWLGLGCRLGVGAVVNRVVRLEVVIQLRDTRFAADTAALTLSLQAILKAHFDEKSDWWIFRLATLRAVCSRVDRRRVLSCTSAIVRDAAGVPIAEPTDPAPGATLTHWWLADGAVDVNYITPS
jgi:hypothetical protein